MISIIKREIVEKFRWISETDFLDLLALAQSMPGILAVNIATVIGTKLRGLKGSIVAAAGTILPSFAIILIIAIYLTPDAIKNNRLLSRVFMGIRPAVVALIIAPVITWKTVIIPIAVALLIYSKIPIISNPIIYIATGALFGYILHCRSLMKGGKR